MIRRRVYGNKFSGSYGYFMINGDFVNTQSNSTMPHSISKKAFIDNSTTGNFPVSTRTGDAVNGKSMCTGYTMNDGSIIVATTKYLYKSTNGGSSWSKVGNVPTGTGYTYWNSYFQPVLYCSGNKYYLLYGINNASSATQVTIYITEWNAGTLNPVSTTSIKTFTLGSNTYAVKNTAGANGKVSPHGLFCFRYCLDSGNTRNINYYMIDIPNKKISNPFNQSSQNTNAIYARFECAGMWVNDGSTYGAWVITTSVNASTYYYKKVTCKSLASNVTAPTVTDIGNTIRGIRTGNPIIQVTSCEQDKDQMFWQFGLEADSYLNWYTSSKSMTSFTKMDILRIPQQVAGTENSSGFKVLAIAGLCVSPDGIYGFTLGRAFLVFDLVRKKLTDAVIPSTTVQNNQDDGGFTTYMTPRVMV